MWEGPYGKTFFSIFKVAVFLGIGGMIGFFLGLAYASHLYGTPPVVAQIQSWLAGDNLYQGPLPVDVGTQRDSTRMLMDTPIAIIPKLGACFGVAIAASIVCGHVIMRVFFDTLGKQESKPRKSAPVDAEVGNAGADNAPLQKNDPDSGEDPS